MATSRPAPVAAASLHWVGLGLDGRSATLRWAAPHPGRWRLPILGYNLRVSTDKSFSSKVPEVTGYDYR